MAAANTAQWAPLDALVNAQIAAGKLPGAVLEVGDDKGLIYRRAYGCRRREPDCEAMTEDTIFDLASVTKVIVTTTAILQLAEQGRIKLDAPAARYWPAFGAHGKADITVRQLLSHTSGLPADLDLRGKWRGEADAMAKIEALSPQTAPGASMRYSDVNFEALGELVERISGQRLDAYSHDHIFGPLKMADTGFLPADELKPRLAPTSVGTGAVHDPSAARMDGVAGHAGLFGTADDLARFARMLLNGGELDGARILGSDTIVQMGALQSPASEQQWRGLGWQLYAPLVANRDAMPPIGAIGHRGYTGTAIWVDPYSKHFVVLLSNRVYPNDGGDAAPLRREVLSYVASLQAPGSLAALPQDTSAPWQEQSGPKKVVLGIDQLETDGFAPLRGKHVGLITNLTGLDSHGRRTIDALRWVPDVTLAAVLTPEHGLYSNREGQIESEVEPASGVPLRSLYGSHRKPTDDDLAGVDALVFDMQDAGARFYTYISTLGYALEAAAAHHIPLYVLDRPNPISAAGADGPMLDEGLHSFTAYFDLPVQHGMTLGELAQMFNGENHIGADLHVITMAHYRRDSWYDEMGIDWVPPSPNLRTVAEAALYPGVALVESANVSVGRGTDTPFELVGAPWIDGAALAQYLAKRKIAGVRFEAAQFTPSASIYESKACQGVRIHLTDRDDLRAPRLGIEIAAALHKLYPQRFELEKNLSMMGTRATMAALERGTDPARIEAQWQVGLREFAKRRQGYLIY
jgi:uncharacterized protein YbbC (DUF1343 family)/CubicO group peptidase (beta-lactamase class C family)